MTTLLDKTPFQYPFLLRKLSTQMRHTRAKIPGHDPPHSSFGAEVCRSISLIMASKAPKCQKNDQNIQRERPIIDIPDVMLDSVFHILNAGRLSTGAADLRPTSDPRLYAMALRIPDDARLIVVIMYDSMRPWSDDRHIAAQHIEELRQFVKTSFAQPFADPGYPRVVSHRLRHAALLEYDPHRPKFQNAKFLSAEAPPLLLEDHRPA